MQLFAFLVFTALAGDAFSRPAPLGSVDASFGKEDRKLVDPSFAPYKAVVHISSRTGNCTGTLVGRNLVLTAAHCVDSAVNPEGRLVSAVWVHVGYEDRRSARTATVRRVKMGWVGTAGVDKPAAQSRALDWAFLVLSRNLGDRVGPLMTLAEAATVVSLKISQKRNLILAGYNSNLYSGERLTAHIGCAIQGPISEGGLFLHDCDTARGSSGGALFTCESSVLGTGCQIHGLNVAEHREKEVSPLDVTFSLSTANIGVQVGQFYSTWKALLAEYPEGTVSKKN